MIVKLRNCSPKTTTGLGASVAEQHMSRVHKTVADGTLPPGSLIILDYAGLAAVNASYIKATAHWLYACGQLSAKSPESVIAPRHPADVRPCDVFVAVSGLTEDVLKEFQEFLLPRKTPLVLARKFQDEAIQEASLLGYVDPTLLSTLKSLCQRGRSTAPELFQDHPDQKVTVTAWNNRLSDLHELRLVRRFRAGRAWEYETLARRFTWE